MNFLLKNIFILSSIVFFTGCSLVGQQVPENDKKDPDIRVAASLFPIADITRNIVGDGGEVYTILPLGASPHTYEPTISDIRNINKADILFIVGNGIDTYAMDIADSIESLDVVTVDESIVLREFSDSHDDEHEDDGHDHTGIDPHYWLDFNNAQVIAQTIYTKLSEKYPEKESIFKENYDAYMVELNDARIRSQKKLGELTNKNIITFHDAWRYFAEEMGLVVVGSFEPEAGKQPGPQFITTLMDSINEHDVKALFSEPQLSDDVVRVLSDDMDLPVYILDPLGGTVDKESYIEMMEYNVNVIYNALQ